MLSNEIFQKKIDRHVILRCQCKSSKLIRSPENGVVSFHTLHGNFAWKKIFFYVSNFWDVLIDIFERNNPEHCSLDKGSILALNRLKALYRSTSHPCLSFINLIKTLLPSEETLILVIFSSQMQHFEFKADYLKHSTSPE